VLSSTTSLLAGSFIDWTRVVGIPFGENRRAEIMFSGWRLISVITAHPKIEYLGV